MRFRLSDTTHGTMSGCARGTTTIEFAVVAPVLFIFLMGIMELGLVFFTTSVLEGATNIGSRLGKTGYTEGGQPRETFIRNQIQQMSGGYLDPGLLDISILSYASFNDVGQPETCNNPPVCDDFEDVNNDGVWSQDQGEATAGERGEVVLYRVSYPWTLFTPIMRQMLGDTNGRVNISAIATVRNEPF